MAGLDSSTAQLSTASAYAAALQATLLKVGAIDTWYGGSFVTTLPSHVLPLSALVDDPRLLDEPIAHIMATEDICLRHVAAGYVFGDLAWRVLAPTLACALLDGMAPAISTATVAVAFGATGWTTGATFLDHGVLTAQPAPLSADLDATESSGEMALLRAVRAQAVDTLRPLLPVFRPLVRRSERTLWGEIGDTVAEVFMHLGGLCQREGEYRATADALLDGTPPLVGSIKWVPISHAGITCTWRVRNTCCHAYEVGKHRYCGSCPLLDEASREERFREWNERRAAEIAQAEVVEAEKAV